MKQVVLDAGALIALDRGAATVRGYVRLADQASVVLATSSAVVAQVWRGGARQARLSRFLSSDLVIEIPLDPKASRQIGALAAAVGTSLEQESSRVRSLRERPTDAVDGHVALIALDRDAVVLTSDPDDIARWGVAQDKIVHC